MIPSSTKHYINSENLQSHTIKTPRWMHIYVTYGHFLWIFCSSTTYITNCCICFFWAKINIYLPTYLASKHLISEISRLEALFGLPVFSPDWRPCIWWIIMRLYIDEFCIKNVSFVKKLFLEFTIWKNISK